MGQGANDRLGITQITCHHIDGLPVRASIRRKASGELLEKLSKHHQLMAGLLQHNSGVWLSINPHHPSAKSRHSAGVLEEASFCSAGQDELQRQGGASQVEQLQSLRGMVDLCPPPPAGGSGSSKPPASTRCSCIREIRTPLLEATELFARGIGEATDVVGKEMYSFSDRGDRSCTLRPEGTASVVRAAIQHGLLSQGAQRLWYGGPMFRYERPQGGRQRQFHQIGVEFLGFA